MKELTLAVKEIALFLFASGNLSSDFSISNLDTEGQKAHSYWQNKYQQNDTKEYYVKQQLNIQNYTLTIHGFIDGVLVRDKIIIEEIKSTLLPLEIITDDKRPEHFAQLMIYGYLYCLEQNLKEINLRLTYLHIPEYENKAFDYSFSIEELKTFFDKCLLEYLTWIDKINEHSNKLLEGVKTMKFPFENYRQGQKKFMKECFLSIKNKEILYAIAPTGIGKTMSVIFSTLKTLSNNKQKIFYLTAKNSGKKIAIETIQMLKDVKIKAIILSSKEKTCFLDEINCDPTICPYAKDYFNKQKEATYDIYDNYDIFDYDTIRLIAKKHMLCPFEFGLYLSYYSDIIIGDYNYAFDPRAHLIRYFDTFNYEHILLIDEAHNMINRSREMFSTTLDLDNLKKINTYCKRIKPSIKKEIIDFNNSLINYDNNYNCQLNISNINHASLRKILTKLEDLFIKKSAFDNRKELLDIYYEIKHFIRISELFNSDFRLIYDNNFLSLNCLNASKYIMETINNHSIGTVFFSATLYPIDYYRKLITNDNGKIVKIPSPFNNNNLKIIAKKDAKAKFKSRLESIEDIIKCIDIMTSYQVGNYIVFFPSYEYLNMVVDALNNPNYEYIVQTPIISDNEKNAIINEFKDSSYTKVGFFVIGGVFSEGIDYLGDMLNGVMIVSVSLPMINNYNNMLKDYFDELINDGFLYSYMIPGMAKVIQAVGRVIRSETDHGIAILYDERFSYSFYKALFPDTFINISYVSGDIKPYVLKHKNEMKKKGL